MTRFKDRREAGRLLAAELKSYSDDPKVVVLALPRGGVAVGFEIAKALKAPLDVFLVRKLGTPGHRELAMGAIASGGVRVLNESVIRQLRIDGDAIAATAAAEEQEMKRREEAYRRGKEPLDLRGGTAILVDDGLATGATMRAAVQAVRARGASAVVVAVPVAAPDSLERIEREADKVFCLMAPDFFQAVGQWYDEFGQVTDTEVLDLLDRERPEAPGG